VFFLQGRRLSQTHRPPEKQLCVYAYVLIHLSFDLRVKLGLPYYGRDLELECVGLNGDDVRMVYRHKRKDEMGKQRNL